MKKIWLVLWGLCYWLPALAEVPSLPYTTHPVDSLYQKLTIAGRVGQLIDYRIKPTFENITQLEEEIKGYQVGSITISGGEIEAAVILINRLDSAMRIPVFVTVENPASLDMPFDSPIPVPSVPTVLATENKNSLKSMIEALATRNRQLGFQGVNNDLLSIRFSKDKVRLQAALSDGKNMLFAAPELYSQNKIAANTGFYFDLADGFPFSPKAYQTLSASQLQEATKSFLDSWSHINNPSAVITIKAVPAFPAREAGYFYKKIMNPLFWKHLQFEGIIAADVKAVKADPHWKNDRDIIEALVKAGADKVITEHPDIAFNALMSGLRSHYLRQGEIKEKTKKILRLKTDTAVKNRKQIYQEHIPLLLGDPGVQTQSYLAYARAMKMEENSQNLMPFPWQDTIHFASLSLGFSSTRIFQETLEKYAPFVHFQLPDVSFDPWELNMLFDQLSAFDLVIVGLHTTGLLSLDGDAMEFLKRLNRATGMVIVFLGPEINREEFAGFRQKILAHEDNAMTQQLAAQMVFGALPVNKVVQRLSYSTPEMQGMDSHTLKKIDEVIEEAIKEYATPGCQVLIARNGSIVMEKGYGYYTYDSLMPVDTRTIYDLASITKIAATTQAIMKLYEQGLIVLDSTMGSYLPELEGTNKASLVIRDVLAHQSGLKPFYPFWRNTIEDNAQIIQYYNDHPTGRYSNTVAPGMFATEQLKDSLWHWTVETRLLRKNKNESYGYKYSDLGFYLLQMLVERISGIPLDVYVDSVFYKPLGVSTMTYNPLCKFPMQRIAPTERDTEFRHALVWGTVHDQIAAMRGGVSGHAGLFSNAHDIAKIMEMQLQDGWYGGRKFLEKETIEKFTTRQFENNRRGLGWDKPEKEEEYNPASRYSSFKSFGHRGFTGTIAWADPTFHIVFVFLSNRIFPDAENKKLIDFNIRERIHDIVYEAMWNYEKIHN